jgi:hypothetical protein
MRSILSVFSSDLPGFGPATLNGMILYYCLMTKWSGLGDSTELSQIGLSQRPLAAFSSHRRTPTPPALAAVVAPPRINSGRPSLRPNRRLLLLLLSKSAPSSCKRPQPRVRREGREFGGGISEKAWCIGRPSEAQTAEDVERLRHPLRHGLLLPHPASPLRVSSATPRCCSQGSLHPCWGLASSSSDGGPQSSCRAASSSAPHVRPLFPAVSSSKIRRRRPL